MRNTYRNIRAGKMNITRRSVIISAGAAAAAFSLPAMAKPIITESPLIATQFGDTGYMLRIVYTPVAAESPFDIAHFYAAETPKTNRMNLNAIKVTAQDGTLVTSIRDAEDLIFSKASVANEKWIGAGWGSTDSNGVVAHNAGAPFSFGLRRQASVIAAHTRRSWPNGVLMHPSMAEKLRDPKNHGGWVKEDIGPKIGRWQEVGVMQKCGIVYVSDEMSEDEAVLFYNGCRNYSYDLYNNAIPVTFVEGNKLDAAAIFLDDGKQLHLIVSEADDIHPSGIDAYVRRVKFT
jgi:hypothetical protein